MTVLDKLFSEQQVRGLTVKSHNVLCHDDIYKLYHSYFLSKNTPATYQCRMIFNLALMTAMRPSELYKIVISKFNRMIQGNTAVWKIFGRIGSIYCTVKNLKGGFKEVRLKSKAIYILTKI